MIARSLWSLLDVIGSAARVLGAHWPALVGIFLAGWTGRLGFLWLAVFVSDYSPTAALFIVVLAPMATLLSLVLMMRATAPSLPAFADLFSGVSLQQRVRTDLEAAAQVLVPFVAVYASAGLLRADINVFLYDTTADELLNAAVPTMDLGRAVYAQGWALAALVLFALAARKIISLLALSKRSLAWAFAGVYLEVLWMMSLTAAFTAQVAQLTDWVLSRRLIAGLLDFWNQAVTTVESGTTWPSLIIESVASFLGSLGPVVAVPIAWLAIGVAIYGYKLKDIEWHFASHDAVTERLQRVPNPVKRVFSQVVEPVVTPITDTLGNIVKIARAGIVPMVLLCVVFVLANQVSVAAAWLVRLVRGPGGDLRNFALAPYGDLVERGAYFVVVVALLAAAVNAIVSTQRTEAEAQVDTETPQSAVSKTK